MASRIYSSVEVKVGIFLAFSLALFVAMLASYGRLAPVWRGRTEIKVVFSNVAGLSPDAPVRYNGVEVGRVKQMRLLHLDKDALNRFPVLTKRDLDNLPLWPESLVKELRELSDADFDTRCRQALQNRTMIELTLEVLQEGDIKRYRLDDTVRIASTIYGDSAVEIYSGNGAINQPGSSTIIVGTAGDFFSNLAKSMGDVKEILGGVTDVVGTQERRSFERASGRFANIAARMDKMSKLADDRQDVTARRVDALTTHVSKILNDSGDALEGIEPQARRSFDAMKDNMSNAQERIKAVQADASSAFKEISTDFKLVRDNVSFAMDQSKPQYEPMKASIRDVYDRLGGLSEHIDDMRDTAGNVMVQSEPDLDRMMQALKNSLQNLKYTGQAANENKDLMISNRDLGEYEYASALDIYRRLTMATRRIVAAGAEVQETRQFLARVQAPVAQEGMPGPQPAQPFQAKADSTVEQLAAMRRPLERVRDMIEEKMLPEFSRKKSAWVDDPPPAPK